MMQYDAIDLVPDWPSLPRFLLARCQQQSQSRMTGLLALAASLGLNGCMEISWHLHQFGPVSYTHLTLPTNREV